MTILAIVVLEGKFGEKKDECEMILQKAKSFLRKKGIKEMINDLMAIAKVLLQ